MSRPEPNVPVRETPYGVDYGGHFNLLECPICGADLSGQTPTWIHISKHDPEDFGLSPQRSGDQSGGSR